MISSGAVCIYIVIFVGSFKAWKTDRCILLFCNGLTLKLIAFSEGFFAQNLSVAPAYEPLFCTVGNWTQKKIFETYFVDKRTPFATGKKV